MQVTWTWLLSKSCFNRYSINSQNRSFDSGIWLNYRTFNRSGATPVVAFDVTKDFSRVWLAGRLHKLTSYGILCRVFCIISSFLSSRWLRAVLNGKFSQDSPVNAAVSPGFTLGPTFFLLYINNYSMCNKAFYLWELIEFTSERESDLRHQGGLGSGSLISMLKKLNLFHLICLVVLLIWQWMGLLLNKNHLLRCWDCHSLLNWIMILRLFLLLKASSLKIGAWIRSMKFLSCEVSLYLHKSTKRLCMEYCCRAANNGRWITGYNRVFNNLFCADDQLISVLILKFFRNLH